MMEFAQRLKADAEWLEEALDQALPVCHGEQASVVEAMRYSLLGGGKRLRGALALECCRAWGGSEEAVRPFCCALEMVHAYSLIHDDLPCMDDDDLRRGKPSCHVAYGEATALLAGDGLLTAAFETMLQAPGDPQRTLSAALVLARAIGTGGMIGGQVMDLANEGRTVPIQSVQETDRLKTGALIEAAAVMGSMIGGAGEGQLASIRAYAQAVGVAFQITDDILDQTSTSQELGKPVGSDEQNQKTTYVSAYGISGARQIAEDYIRQAKDALREGGIASSFLEGLADFVLERRN